MPEPHLIAILMAVSFTAGWIDAVVGGGGLLQLPAMLLALPAAAPAQILATNKIASFFGTATAAVTYVRRVKPDRATILAMAPPALLGSAGGAACAKLLPQSLFRPMVLVLLIVVAIYTALRPNLGLHHEVKHSPWAQRIRAAAIGAGIGFYDGIFGPGTGSFLVIAMVSILGFSFLQASATARVTNAATNLGAIIIFVAAGAPMWQVGLPMGLANLAGGYLGARTAIARGNSFVRIVFLVVVAGLIIRLGYDVLR